MSPARRFGGMASTRSLQVFLYAILILGPVRFLIYVTLQFSLTQQAYIWLIYYLYQLYKYILYRLQFACLHDMIIVCPPLHLGQLICSHNEITMTLRDSLSFSSCHMYQQIQRGTTQTNIYQTFLYFAVVQQLPVDP